MDCYYYSSFFTPLHPSILHLLSFCLPSPSFLNLSLSPSFYIISLPSLCTPSPHLSSSSLLLPHHHLTSLSLSPLFVHTLTPPISPLSLHPFTPLSPSPPSTGEIIAEKHCTARPQDYGLFTVVSGRATLLEDGAMPQEILLEWTLEPPTSTGQGSLSQHQPSSQFIAYKLRAPGSTVRQ